MLCHGVEIGILNVIEFASYQCLYLNCLGTFLWSLFFFSNYQFLHYLVKYKDSNMYFSKSRNVCTWSPVLLKKIFIHRCYKFFSRNFSKCILNRYIVKLKMSSTYLTVSLFNNSYLCLQNNQNIPQETSTWQSVQHTLEHKQHLIM